MRKLIQTWRDWWLIGVLALLCAILSILQYRWTGEAGEAERQRMRASLELQLRQWKRSFETEISESISVLTPSAEEIESRGREAAHRRHHSDSPLFRRVAVAEPKDGDVALFLLNQRDGSMNLQPWPAEWQYLKQQFLARLTDRFGPRLTAPATDSPVIERPIMSAGRELEWLIFELNLEFLRTSLIPELNQRFLNTGEEGGFDVEVRHAGDRSQLIFSSKPSVAGLTSPDIQVEILGDFNGPQGRGPRPPRKNRDERDRPPPPDGRGPGRPPEHGSWVLAAQHGSGSVDAAVALARWRNLAVELLLLALILVAGYSQVRSTTRAKKLAEMQLRFVAGISHELRTPLTVIRGAGHNLLSGFVKDRDHVDRYAKMIVQHSEHLTEIIEQILAFASTREKRNPVTRAVVSIPQVLEQAIALTAAEVEAAGCKLECRMPSELPPVRGDAVALRGAIQNLIVNAAKHGGGGRWIGIEANSRKGDERCIEISVSDRGPGIAEDELTQIFDPFFRGERARLDQVRGTGLGLSLIQDVALAHGGKISARNGETGGARFTLQLPEANKEQYDKLANSIG